MLAIKAATSAPLLRARTHKPAATTASSARPSSRALGLRCTAATTVPQAAKAASKALPAVPWLPRCTGAHDGSAHQGVATSALRKAAAPVKKEDDGVPEQWREAVRLWRLVDWGKIDTLWQSRYWEMVQHVYDEGRVPPQGSTGVNRWVKHQTQNRACLMPVLQQLLAAVPSWPHPLRPDPVNPAWFDAQYDAYKEMAEAKGGPLAQTGTPGAERKLARWVLDMKGCGMYHEGLLSNEQREALEELPGFKWEIRNLGKKGPGGVVGPKLPFFSLDEVV